MILKASSQKPGVFSRVFRQELLEEWKQEAMKSGTCCKYRKMVLITGVMSLQEKNKVLKAKLKLAENAFKGIIEDDKSRFIEFGSTEVSEISIQALEDLKT